MSQSNSKKSKWRIVRELEDNLKILKRGRREFRLVIISMLEETLDLMQKGEEPMLVARSVRERGKHRYSTVHSVFSELSNYSPQLIRPFNNFDNGKIGRLTQSFYDIICHDVKIWEGLENLGEVSESDLISVQKLGKLLDKFCRLANSVVRV